MSIQEKIEADFQESLKKQDKIAISTFRMLKSALHNKEIEAKVTKLDDAQVVKIINKQVQQHQDSIEQFSKGNRPELVKKETQELEILKKYLPKQLSEAEVTKAVEKIITELGAKDKRDFGKVMKAVMNELKGKTDGKLASQIVAAKLEFKQKD